MLERHIWPIRLLASARTEEEGWRALARETSRRLLESEGYSEWWRGAAVREDVRRAVDVLRRYDPATAERMARSLALREARRTARLADPLARRQPGRAVRALAWRRAEAARKVAGFRVAAHGHTDRMASVEPGDEYAEAEVTHVRPTEAGLPSSYGYRVAQSTHTWWVSTRILDVPVDAHRPGVLYLAPDVRVRQGRGTTLRVERLRRDGARSTWVAD